MTAPKPRVIVQPGVPSLAMKLASVLLGARARRREGTPVDLARERRSNDMISRLLRAPSGVDVTEETVGGVPVVRLSAGGRERGTLLYLHGGAYALGSARQAITVAAACADGEPDIVSVEYRLAPEHPCPAAVDDALAVYSALIDSTGAQRLVVVGESAGGGLALLTLQRAVREGLSMPAALMTAFPWADLTLSGASVATNAGRDLLTRSELEQEAAWFAEDLRLDAAAVSPLSGSFRGFPRTWISVGTNDLLLDDARTVAAAMAADGVDVRLDEWPGAVHGFTAFPLPEGRSYRRQLRRFIDSILPSTNTLASDIEGPDTTEGATT